MKTPIHVIDVMNPDSLLNLISVRNIIKFATALDHRTYDDMIISPQERLEQEFAMGKYRMFICWFGQQYTLVFGDSLVNPTYLFKWQLICFAATLENMSLSSTPRSRDLTTSWDLVQGQSKNAFATIFNFAGVICFLPSRPCAPILPLSSTTRVPHSKPSRNHLISLHEPAG